MGCPPIYSFQSYERYYQEHSALMREFRLTSDPGIPEPVFQVKLEGVNPGVKCLTNDRRGVLGIFVTVLATTNEPNFRSAGFLSVASFIETVVLTFSLSLQPSQASCLALINFFLSSQPGSSDDRSESRSSPFRFGFQGCMSSLLLPY